MGGGARESGAAALVLLAVLAVPGAWASCDAPTLRTIVVDGLFDDWVPVLAGMRNTTVDGDGSGVTCQESADLDCPVAATHHDLMRFSWTYDDSFLYLFFERAGAGPTDAWLHLDTNADGLMYGGLDRLVHLTVAGPSTDITSDVYAYVPVDPGGDSLADASGLSDGHTIPGGTGPLLGSVTPSGQVSADGERFEAGISWASLGLPGPAPLGFHMALGDAPDQTADSLGGPDDGPGGTAFHDHRLTGPRFGSSPGNQVVHYGHSLENRGNLPDRYQFRTTSTEGWEVALWTDPNGDGDPADGVLLGRDGRGDGDYIDGGDEKPGDTDGDTFPDTGIDVPPGGTYHLVVELHAGRSPKDGTERTVLHAGSLAGGCEQSVLDESAVGAVTLTPRHSLCTEPGGRIDLCHDLHSHLPDPTRVHLGTTSTLGWAWEIWSDPDRDCDASDGAPVPDSDGDGLPDLVMQAGEVAGLVVRADVPPGEALGSTESLTLQAEAAPWGRNQATITDEICVARVLEITPSYLLAGDSAKSAAAGRSLWFAHRIEWAGPLPESFRMTLTPPPGQAAILHTDPNGDGHPSDGAPVTDGVVFGPVDGLGGSFPFLVRLDVDAATPTGTALSLEVEAFAQSTPGVSRLVTDEAVVTAVATYADPLFVLQESRFFPCQGIHALATGLLPAQSGRYRIRWVEESGPATVLADPIDSDVRGEGASTYLSGAGSPAGPHSARLEDWDGIQWKAVDLDLFTLEEPTLMEALDTDRPVYAQVGDDLLAWASFRNPLNSELAGVSMRFLAIDDAGTFHALPDGTFDAWTPGSWTWSFGPSDLGPGERMAHAFTIGAVEFPTEGTYLVRAVVEGSCGALIASDQRTFEVIADADGDGWSDGEEAIHGTDPLDPDTDEDGLPDPLDGDGDADGDQVIDALECDADGDTLPDSVEAGLSLSVLEPYTDPLSGCFRPDGDAGATTTDRLRADTDMGGLPDGAEDLDADGLLEAGEKDPLDPTDDACSWLAPPEVVDLRLTRQSGAVRLAWRDLSPNWPCSTYRILSAEGVPIGDLSDFSETTSSLTAPYYLDPGGGSTGPVRFYLVHARGRIAGDGPIGHYGQ